MGLKLNSMQFLHKEPDIGLCIRIWIELQQLRGYFRWCNSADVEESISATYNHAITHYDSSKGDLTAYLKALARTIHKTRTSKVELACDFSSVTGVSKYGVTTSANILHTHMQEEDFSLDVIDDIHVKNTYRGKVECLALSNISAFLDLCTALQQEDRTVPNKDFPKSFMKDCIALVKGPFKFTCLDVYTKYKKVLTWYMSQNLGASGWQKLDPTLCKGASKNCSVALVDAFTGDIVYDADRYAYRLQGYLKGAKRIVKVSYIDVWEKLCDLLDSPKTTLLKCQLGSHYVCRTLGGSESVLDVDITNLYDNIRLEILTNILYKLNVASVLNVGSECFYLLHKGGLIQDKITFDVNGMSLTFTCEDITETILSL